MIKITKQLFGLLQVVFIILAGCSFNSDDSSVTPNQPTDNSLIKLQSPDAGEKGVPVSGATLSWTTSAPSSSIFQVFVEPTTDSGKVPLTSSWQTTPSTSQSNITSYSTGALSYLTWYAWKVRVVQSSGTWTDSKVHYFKTVDIPVTASNTIKVYDYQTHINQDHDINILFQVSDPSGVGVPGITLDQIEVLEDDETLRESALKLTRQDAAKINLPIHILIDNSTSVTGSNVLARMKADAVQIVNVMNATNPYTSSFFIYEFSENLIPEGNAVPTSVNASTAIAQINSIGNGVQSTDFNGAVTDVARTLNNYFMVDNVIQNLMIVLSDGDDTAGKTYLSSAINAVSGKRVYTMGYKGDLREDVLKTIGVSGYMNSELGSITPFVNNIKSYFTNFSQSFYTLTVTSPKRGYKNHTIAIRLKGSLDYVYVTYPGW